MSMPKFTEIFVNLKVTMIACVAVKKDLEGNLSEWELQYKCVCFSRYRPPFKNQNIEVYIPSMAPKCFETRVELTGLTG